MMLQKRSWSLLRERFFKNKLVLLLIPLVFVAYFSVTRILTIKSVTCQNNNLPCDTQTTEFLSRYQGSNYLGLNRSLLLDGLNKIQPLQSMSTHISINGELSIKIESDKRFLPLNLSLVLGLPQLSFTTSTSSDSASYFIQPTIEIESFLSDLQFTSFDLWFNGNITPAATGSANIYLLTKQKPDPETMKMIFNLITSLNNYLKPERIYILERTIFLSTTGQPDIITSVPYDQGAIDESLQSLGFLTTMKKDPKIIDLRYKNPIIR